MSGGPLYQVSASVSGAVDGAGRKIKGRWHVFWKVPVGGATDICDSGLLTFRATR